MSKDQTNTTTQAVDPQTQAYINQYRQRERYDATTDYVSQNPVKAVAIAFVAGLLIGKILL